MAAKSEYEIFSGIATDDYGDAIVFRKRTKQVDITAFDNSLDVSASYNNDPLLGGAGVGDFECEIIIYAGHTFPTPLACKAVKVRNHIAGQNTRYQIIAWYKPSEYV